MKGKRDKNNSFKSRSKRKFTKHYNKFNLNRNKFQTDDLNVKLNNINNHISVYKREVKLPASCPIELKGKSHFITCNNSSLYESLLNSSYSGFKVAAKEDFESKFHDTFESAFKSLEDNNIFQFDFTQPGGLETPIARTYVSRCLVGDEGITYKYLGLRMFSHPWKSSSKKKENVPHYINNIKDCNDHLIKKTKTFLKHNESENGNQNENEIGSSSGSCEYNLTLINRCFPDGTGIGNSNNTSIKLKDEPHYGGGKVSVSWHADSSLEHYSSIAVYHSLKKENEGYGKKDEELKNIPWRIGCRVAVNSEGPASNKLRQDKGDSMGAPPISVELPDNYAYFLLDDFNHHHQHTVLSGTANRYASTHRVARKQGHNVLEIMDRLKSLSEAARRNNAKQINLEMTILLDVEFEWLRQFYIQGQTHYDLHIWWQPIMKEMFDYIVIILDRVMLKAVEDLEFAGPGTRNGSDPLAGLEQKERRKVAKKIAKAQKRIESVEEKSYEIMVDQLTVLQTKLKGWIHREKALNNHHDIDEGSKPLPCPLDYHDIHGRDKRLKRINSLISYLPNWKADFIKKQQQKSNCKVIE